MDINRELMDRLFLALAAGDSLGATSEFVRQREMPALYESMRPQGWPFKQVGGGKFGWAVGAPTDDTDMALCLVRSAMRHGGFDGEDVAARFVAWLDMAPHDMGATTRETLERVRAGVPWHRGGLEVFRANPGNAANGSLMRNGVVAGIGVDLKDAWRITILHGLITHFSPLPVICCAAQTYLILRLLQEPSVLEGDWKTQFATRFAQYVDEVSEPRLTFWREEARPHMDGAWRTFMEAEFGTDAFTPFGISYRGRSGYCLLTLQIAVWAAAWAARRQPFPVPTNFPTEPFERVGAWTLAWVAMVGHDADTYAAAAGPLVAAAVGGTPRELLDGLQVMSEVAG